MEKCGSNLSFISMYHHLLLLLLLVSFLISSVKATSAVQLMDNSTQDPMCEFVDCGEGRCIASNGVLGFDCECNPGWKKIRIGALTFPSCIVPTVSLSQAPHPFIFSLFRGAILFPSREGNSLPWEFLVIFDLVHLEPFIIFLLFHYSNIHDCIGTLDLQCGKGVSSPPPNPTPASLLPPSFNLLDRNFGAGCTGLGFGQHSPPSPSLSGSIRVSNCWSCLQALTMVALAAVFLVWV
ncbi:hypothetical protein CK203_042973 [Vitis vinifera]|uniref:EGF-like domain-containing protein n=1 Tax=Vitis vinifera TaxID=29760 RepID=A0A438GZD8_VITVI|nr:hypothetical protein CK203_042973 [Vitis vinifera]